MSVTVYKVRAYDLRTDEYVTSRRMATIKGAHEMGGDIVEGSEVEIDEGQLEPGMEWTVRDFNPHATTGFQRQVRV